MSKYLISPDKKQYKANLHCHSTLSDGKKTPEELKEMYQRNGYEVLAITDHEIPKSHNDLTDEHFLMLTGYECYIRPDKDAAYDVYQEEVHLNLFARDPKNEKMICYNNKYCKYLQEKEKEALQKAGSQKTREYSIAYINQYIKTAKEHGYIVAYNHPYWSMEPEERILSYEGLFSVEMCNYSSYLMNHLEYNAALYDKMMRAGMQMYCHAADDNHNKYPEGHPQCDSFGGFTMILSDSLTYDGIFQAMERGEMYASMGPLIHEISVDGDKLHVECSPVASIHLYFGSKTPARAVAEEGEALSSADFIIDGRAQYIRISIFDKEGKAADTRGYRRGTDF